MNPYRHFIGEIEAALGAMQAAGELPAGLDFSAITAEPPRDAAHGDIATNAAMVLAKAAKKKPRDIADALLPRLKANPDVVDGAVAGPGFINLKLRDDFWLKRLGECLQEGPAYGNSTMGGGKKVNVEYVSANPTGPLHVAHARGAVVGDALANLLHKAGYDVTKEYYINDAGAQVDKLGQSTYLRYKEALGDHIGEIPEGLYPGEYLKEIGAAIARRDGARWIDKPEADWLPEMRASAISALMADSKGELDVKLCQLVRVLKNGELVRMSKRAGTFVTLRDLLDEVGPDVVRFTMLTRKNDASFDFDLVKATEQSRDNPVWYVQYGHARTRSVQRQAAAAGIATDGLDSAPFDRLGDAGGLALLRVIAQWPRQVEAAASAPEPHRLAFYLYDP